MPLSPGNVENVVSSVNNVRSESADKSLQAVTQAIANGRGALVVSSALSGFYMDSLWRILEARAAFDRARQLEATDDPRRARLACKDEEKFVKLIDRVIRGLPPRDISGSQVQDTHAEK